MWLVVLILGVAASSVSSFQHSGVHSNGTPLQLTNVTFPSPGVSSGAVTLHGTVVMSEGSTNLRPVVLIGGSGPSNRWENDSLLAPMYHVATHLAASGHAVLAYDKRSCFAGSHPLCAGNVPCTAANQTNCVLVTNITVNDFVADAAAAMEFMRAQPYVAPSDAAFVGHSQGCTVAPMAALQANVSTLVLLMGDGVAVDVLLKDQALAQRPLLQQALQYWEHQPPSQHQAAEVAAVNGTIAAMNCTINYAVEQFDFLRTSVITVGENGVVCPFGVMANYPKIYEGLVCPAACGVGLCVAGKVQPECEAICRVGAEVGACTPIPFAASWLALSEANTRRGTLSQLSARLLAINSWQDLLVTPPTFAPLHSTLASLPNTESDIHTLYNVTHLLSNINSPASPDPGVDPRVLSLLDSFFSA